MHWNLDRVDIPTTSFEELLDEHLSYAEGTKFIQMLNTADPANPVVLPKDWYTNLKAIIDAEGIDDLKVKLTGWTASGNAAPDPVQDDDDTGYIDVVCPEGAIPGEILVVTLPDGREVEAEVPDGISPGNTFQVQSNPPPPPMAASDGGLR